MKDIFALLIALIHVYIFVLESIVWGKPRTNKSFGVSAEEARINAVMAFNQGFYNLFLAVAIAIGLIFVYLGRHDYGRAMVDYAATSVFGAGAVLFFSARRLRRPAMVQLLPALLYWIFRLI